MHNISSRVASVTRSAYEGRVDKVMPLKCKLRMMESSCSMSSSKFEGRSYLALTSDVFRDRETNEMSDGSPPPPS